MDDAQRNQVIQRMGADVSLLAQYTGNGDKKNAAAALTRIIAAIGLFAIDVDQLAENGKGS